MGTSCDSNFQKGDVLKKKTRICGIDMEHYALHTGKGIIHNTNKSDKILEQHLSDDDLRKQGYERVDCCFYKEEAIRKARSKIGEVDYNLLTNNCEHFVNECIGRNHSTQIQHAVNNTAGVAGAVIAAGVFGVESFGISYTLEAVACVH